MQKPIAVRLDEQAVAAVNEWRRRYEDPPTKSEALRLLVEAQLKSLGMWEPEAALGDTAKGSAKRARKS